MVRCWARTVLSALQALAWLMPNSEEIRDIKARASARRIRPRTLFYIRRTLDRTFLGGGRARSSSLTSPAFMESSRQTWASATNWMERCVRMLDTLHRGEPIEYKRDCGVVPADEGNDHVTPTGSEIDGQHLGILGEVLGDVMDP